MPDLARRRGRRALRQGLRRRHGGRSSRPALPAVRLDALRKLRARDELSDEDMVRVQRANLLDPVRAQPVGRDAAARLPAAQIRRPHPRDRGAEPDRPARRRSDLRARSMAAASGIVPYVHAGLRARQGGRRRCSTRNPKVEGLILHKHGIFTFGDERARSLRAHDRAGHAAPRSGWRAIARRCSSTAQLPQAVAPRADVAPLMRGAVQPQGREGRRRVAAADPRFPHDAGACSISSMAPRSRATARPAWSRRTTPSAPRTGR